MLEHPAAEDERQPMAALGLVHVVGGHHDGRALGGDRVDPLPELAPADRVDAGRGLVEEQQRRLVDGRAGQGQPLLPAARQGPGELLAALRRGRSAR